MELPQLIRDSRCPNFNPAKFRHYPGEYNTAGWGLWRVVVSACMKAILPGGQHVILPNPRALPIWPNVPNSRPWPRPIYYERWTPVGPFHVAVVWTLKNGLQFVYDYDCVTEQYMSMAVRALGGPIPQNPLCGGEFYNYVLRRRLVSKVPT